MEAITIEELKDLCGYIFYALKEQVSPITILTTIAHDLNGFVARHYGDKYWTPRTGGYGKYLFLGMEV